MRLRVKVCMLQISSPNITPPTNITYRKWKKKPKNSGSSLKRPKAKMLYDKNRSAKHYHLPRHPLLARMARMK